jgi:catechol 2,3-dioxygenase-like lactoylglutathione lyase family enzyme
MAILLNHTIVLARDKEASAQFFARIFGLRPEPPAGHFAPVRVNDTLTLDFDHREQFEPHHYAFHVSEEEFDQIFGRIQGERIPYGSGPRSLLWSWLDVLVHSPANSAPPEQVSRSWP